MNDYNKSICVIPAFNEETTISSVINLCLQYVDTVLVINDASTDATLNILKHSNAQFISNKSNLGYEISLKKGFNYAIKNCYDYIIFVDADGQHPCELLPLFLSKLKSGYSIVLGRRNKLPRFSERFASTLYSVILNIDDPFCGMKAFNVTQVKSYLILKNTDSFGLSILSYFLQFRPSISQIDISVKNRVCGKSRVGINNMFIDYLLIKSSIIFLLKIIFFKARKY